MTEPVADDAFWRFACDIYATPCVRDACLNLQDRSDHHVNLLLGALWITGLERKISADNGERIRRRSLDWHSAITKPLRSVRRAYNESVGLLASGLAGGRGFGSDTERSAVLKAIKDAELAVERLELSHLQPMLLNLSSQATGSTFLVWHNLEALSPWSEDDLHDVRELVAALVLPQNT